MFGDVFYEYSRVQMSQVRAQITRVVVRVEYESQTASCFKVMQRVRSGLEGVEPSRGGFFGHF